MAFRCINRGYRWFRTNAKATSPADGAAVTPNAGDHDPYSDEGDESPEGDHEQDSGHDFSCLGDEYRVNFTSREPIARRARAQERNEHPGKYSVAETRRELKELARAERKGKMRRYVHSDSEEDDPDYTPPKPAPKGPVRAAIQRTAKGASMVILGAQSAYKGTVSDVTLTH